MDWIDWSVVVAITFFTVFALIGVDRRTKRIDSAIDRMQEALRDKKP